MGATAIIRNHAGQANTLPLTGVSLGDGSKVR